MGFTKLNSTSRFTGIQVSIREIELLKVIHEFNVFPASNVHRIYSAGLSKPRTKGAISMRIRKLVKSGLVIQLKSETIINGQYHKPSYAYRLGARGLDLLEQEGYISEKEAQRGKNYNYHLGMPTPHNKSVSTIFTCLFETCAQEEETLESLGVGSLRGDKHQEISLSNLKTGYSPIIPDWVYETEEHIICLELDTGTQSRSIINMKFDRYKRLTEFLSKPLIVVFSVGLSVVSDIKDSKEKRVSSLKELFTEYQEWPDDFEIYVVPTFRTPELIGRLLRSKLSLSKLFTKGAANNWLNYVRQAANQNSIYFANGNEELKKLFFKDPFDLDIVTELVRGNRFEPIGLLYMEEGSVRSYQKARANIIRVNAWNTQRALSGNQAVLLLVYEHYANGSNDVISLQPLSKTFIANIEQVKEVAKFRSEEFPPLIEIVSPYTRSERRFL